MKIKNISLQLIILLCLSACERDAPPSAYAMREHIVGKLTEQQIREIHAEAEKDFEQAIAEAKKNESEFWAKRAEKVAKYGAQCQEIGFKTKNPDKCDNSLPISWNSVGSLPAGYESVDSIFEKKLMGICNFADTVTKAKRLGCLP